MKIAFMFDLQRKKIQIHLLFFFIFCHFLQSCTKEEPIEYKKKEYTIAIPFQSQQTQLSGLDKNLVGFLSDFALSIGRRGGISVKLISIDPNEMESLFANGSIDGCFAALPMNYLTKQSYSFSNPVFMNGTVVIVSSKSSFQTSLDLRNTRLCFDSTKNGAISMVADPSWFLSPTFHIFNSLEKVDQGVLDGVILNYMQARMYISPLFNGKYKILFPAIFSENIALIVPKNGFQELINLSNRYQRESIKSGEYKQQLTYWNLDMPIEEEILLQ